MQFYRWLAQLRSKGSSRAFPSPHGAADAGLPPLHAMSLSATGSGLSSPLLPLLSRSLKDVDGRVQSLQDTCSRLPRESYNNLRCFAGKGLLQPQAITGGSRSLPESVLTAPLALLLPHRYLIKFLAKLAEHQELNKMTPSNIAIVLGPNLLWTQQSTG